MRNLKKGVYSTIFFNNEKLSEGELVDPSLIESLRGEKIMNKKIQKLDNLLLSKNEDLKDEFIDDQYADYEEVYPTKNHFIYRKVEKDPEGNLHGKWAARKPGTSKVFDITYNQALGYDPIDECLDDVIDTDLLIASNSCITYCPTCGAMLQYDVNGNPICKNCDGTEDQFDAYLLIDDLDDTCILPDKNPEGTPVASIGLSEDVEDDLEDSEQEITSANTSINSTLVPAVFRLVNWQSDTLNLDYGGGKFDNATEFLSTLDVQNVIYDPFNRTYNHNHEVLKLVSDNGGADTVTLSNVLNVIKEENERMKVLRNIKKLMKPSGKLYITVYEGNRFKEGKETKSGYQLNRPTSNYLNEISQVFPTVTRKGKLIIATNDMSESFFTDPQDAPYKEFDDVSGKGYIQFEAVVDVTSDEIQWEPKDLTVKTDMIQGSDNSIKVQADEHNSDSEVMLIDSEKLYDELDDIFIEHLNNVELGTYNVTGSFDVDYNISNIAAYQNGEEWNIQYDYASPSYELKDVTVNTRKVS